MRHIKCYRAIALTLLIMSKNVSDKSYSVREVRHTRSPYFLWVQALKLLQGQLHFFTWNHVFFFRWHYYRFQDEFTDLQYKVNLVTQSMKIVEKSKHIGIITCKGSTNLGLGLTTEDARSDDPWLVSTC